MAALPRLLTRHTRLFNQGVRTGDFAPMVAGFTPDAELVFHGITGGPYVGRAAIAAAYRERPPDDEIVILEAHEENGTIVASYAWARAPGVQAGGLVLTPAGSHIARLVVLYGGPGRSARPPR